MHLVNLSETRGGACPQITHNLQSFGVALEAPICPGCLRKNSWHGPIDTNIVLVGIYRGHNLRYLYASFSLYIGVQMATLVIKNLPEPLHFKLKERAKRNHRSLTKETIALIERAVALPPIDEAGSKNLLAAIFAAGDAMALQGVNFQDWAASSRDVWR